MEPPNKKQKKDDSGTLSDGFLQGVCLYIVQTGIGKARSDLFQRQVEKNGGTYCENYSEKETNHILVDENMDVKRMCRIMKLDNPPDPEICKVVHSRWLSSCLKDKSLVDSSSYELNVEQYLAQKQNETAKLEAVKKSETTQQNTSCQPSTSAAPTTNDQPDEGGEEKVKKAGKVGIMYHTYKSKVTRSEVSSDVDSDYVDSGAEENKSDHSSAEEEQDTPPGQKKLPRGNWVCARSSLAPRKNCNKHITDKLEALAKTYENTNDKWRALGYSKAIAALKAYPKEITTFEEAKALRGVGNRLAEKVWEIIESGELRKLNELTSSEEIKAINMFTNIWGAGAQTARAWVIQGFRTLDDIQEKANLTRHQKIGLKYYEELLDRMSREEAGQIEKVVIDAAAAINPGLICMACGSYRREKVDCGDVDVLITHPDGKSHKGVFHKLLTNLRQSGFITDDLVSQEENGNQKKYLGVCILPVENAMHRRLDIIVVPYDEFACASMYFTGSAHCNRSMRNLASKMNMSLNEHGLFAGVVRKQGEKINKGYPLYTPTEESVFKHLGLVYRPPNERNH